MKFKYRLAGLDPRWIDAGSRRTAYFSPLPPGTYTFTVIADNGEGVWNAEGKSLSLIVVPAFYQTRSFVVLAVVTGAGLLALAWNYRVRQWQRAQAAQQAFARQLIASQEAERKRIAAELHDGLGQHLVVIKNLALLSLNERGDGEGGGRATVPARASGVGKRLNPWRGRLAV